jgi:hypothetical protein
LRFTFVAAAYHPCTPHSSGFARLASGAFYAAITWATFYEIIKIWSEPKKKEVEKMGQKWLAFLVMPLFFIGCTAMEPLQKREDTYGKGIPVITDSYAAKEIRPGETWLVFLKANHPDRGMKRIVCTIARPGIGAYPKSFTRIKSEESGELDGYIFLSTAKYTNSLNMATLTLTIQIEDQAGHLSETVSFPLSLNNTYKQQPPPAGRFKNSDLGPIMIEIHSPSVIFRP